jgi:hypothetical protein
LEDAWFNTTMTMVKLKTVSDRMLPTNVANMTRAVSRSCMMRWGTFSLKVVTNLKSSIYNDNQAIKKKAALITTG